MWWKLLLAYTLAPLALWASVNMNLGATNSVMYQTCEQSPIDNDIENSLKVVKIKDKDGNLMPMDAKTKASYKSCEIQKHKGKLIGTFVSGNYTVEILSVDTVKINNNDVLEVFAKAWKNDKPLGFTRDGSVEIERFHFYNPPVLVEDNNGNINRDWVNPITKELMRRRLKEDPAEALRQELVHTIFLVGKENTNITIGKRGNTTSVFYPDASAESTSVDGAASRESGLTSWASSRVAAGNASQDSSATGVIVQSEQAGVNDYPISRGFFLFDTSALGDTDTISSATLSISSSANGNNTEAINPADIAVTASGPASDTAIVTSDYDIANWSGFTTEFITRYDLGTFIATSGYHDWALNASGLANISVSGISKFGTRATNDIDNAAPAARSYGLGYFADQTGTTNDPKLTVVHTSVTKSIESDTIIFE